MGAPFCLLFRGLLNRLEVYLRRGRPVSSVGVGTHIAIAGQVSTFRTGRQMQEIFRHNQAVGPDLRAVCHNLAPRSRSAPTGNVWLRALRCAVLLCGCCQTVSAGTLVTLNFTNPSLQLGTVQIDLFDNLTPVSAANFVNYINNSRYNDTIIHRVDTGLGVIQGGGFDTQGQGISTFSPIVNEYSAPNLRGTISMARTSDINSATSQWFINTVDNTTTLGQSNGGGYAVFGWVIGGGMTVVDKIHAIPITNAGGVFNQLPTVNHTPGTQITPDQLVVLSSAVFVKTHPNFQNPLEVLDVNYDNIVTSLDALVVINDLISHNNHAVNSTFQGGDYIDVNGDGQVTPLDALQVINHFLNDQSLAVPLASSQLMKNSQADSYAPSSLTLASMVVPEPGSMALAITAAAALGFFVLRRRARRFMP